MYSREDPRRPKARTPPRAVERRWVAQHRVTGQTTGRLMSILGDQTAKNEDMYKSPYLVEEENVDFSLT